MLDKNLDWLKNKVNSLETEVSEYMPHNDMIDRDEVLDLIDQLDEPEITDPTLSKKETVEVPQTIGAYIKKERGKNTLGNIADEIYNSEESWSNLSEEYKWMRLNFTLFARAWLFGYTIKKDKKYFLKNRRGYVSSVMVEQSYQDRSSTITINYTDGKAVAHKFSESKKEFFSDLVSLDAEEVE